MKWLNWALALFFLFGGGAMHADDRFVPRTVEELMATYGWRTDRHDMEGLLPLFEDDATLESPKTGRTLHGREEIAELLAAAWARQPGDERKRRHLITGVRAIGSDGVDTRFTASLGVVGTTDAGETKIYATGYYEGCARMSEQGLRFRLLRIALD